MVLEDVFAAIAPLLQLIAPQPCYDEFFVKFNFFHGRSTNFICAPLCNSDQNTTFLLLTEIKMKLFSTALFYRIQK